MEEKFDIKEFLLGMLKKYKIFLIFIIVTSILFGAISYFNILKNIKQIDESNVDKTYYIILKLENTYSNEGDYIADKVYSHALNILKSGIFIDEAYKEFINNTPENIKNKYNINATNFIKEKYEKLISVNFNTNSPIIQVSITQQDIELSELIIDSYYNTIEKVLPEYVTNITTDLKEFTNISKSEDTGTINKIKSALKHALLGAMLGLVLALIFILLCDVMTDKIKSKKDLLYYNIPLLGEVTDKKIDFKGN